MRRCKAMTAAALVLTVLAGIPGAVFAQELSTMTWLIGLSSAGIHMPFRPEDKTVSMQNPPDFKWPHLDSATRYELQICRDAEMTQVAYEAKELTVNYYNFPYLFEADAYYWRVRYFVGDASSPWSEPRRFRIDPDAYPFPVPAIDEIIARVSGAHPRVWTNRQELEAFRALSKKGNGKVIFDAAMQTVQENIAKPLPPEPAMPGGDSSQALLTAQRNLRVESDGIVDVMFKTAFVYLITGDRAIGEFAKNQMLNIASWDPNGSTSYTASVTQSQVHRYIAYKTAMAYDWIYDALTPEERSKVLKMVKARTQVMVNELLDGGNTIDRRPYDSHGWSQFGYIGIVAAATLGDLPEAEGWFRRIIPAYINLLPPWGGEDGGWSQGTGYWQFSTLFNKELMDVLLSATGFSLYDKAFSRNEGLFPLYMFPKGSTGGFGDQSYSPPTGYNVRVYKRLASVYKDPVMQWAWQQIGNLSATVLEDYYNDYEAVEPQPPAGYDRGKWFPDIDWAAMHSDLVDSERISFLFKSSPFGSYNHSHPDQNSFVINAFGERLAIDSGYYDAYDSPHDKGYAKKTYAHNTITYDGGKGQPANDMNAKGDILGFVTHPVFDAVTGDATEAYKGGLGKAVRHVVYIRPSMFIVIDDLESAKGRASSFEWWLNADDDIKVYQSHTGARVTQGKAALDAWVHYPKNMTANYSDRFAGPDGVEYPAAYSFTTSPVQKRVWFAMPPAEKTTIVATLEAHLAQDGTQYVAKGLRKNYMEMHFEDGTRAYIRVEGEEEVDAGAVRFDGAAAVVKGESTLLVAGTSLVQDGVTLVRSDVPATVVMGKGEAEISCFDDGQVTIYAPGIRRLRDAKGRDIPGDGGKRGVSWTAGQEEITFSLERGEHKFYFNEKPLPGQAAEDVRLSFQIGEEAGHASLKAFADIDGNIIATGSVPTKKGLYRVNEISEGVSMMGAKKGDLIWAVENTELKTTGTAPALSLTPVSLEKQTDIELAEDHEALKAACDSFLEAESFALQGGGKAAPYTTRSFLSGGAGLGTMTEEGHWVKWSVSVPEDGTYDIVMKYVAAWSALGDAARIFKIGDTIGSFEAPKTAGYGAVPEQWKALRLKSGVRLEKGQAELTMWLAGEPWNLDWIGLVKSEK